jgi:hypothetical protein
MGPLDMTIILSNLTMQASLCFLAIEETILWAKKFLCKKRKNREREREREREAD